VKVMFDHCMPPRFGHGFAGFFPHDTVVNLRDKFPTRVKDEEWIRVLSEDGNWVVISKDRRITRNKSERVIFKASNVIGFFLSRSLHKAPPIVQAWRLMQRWEEIRTQSNQVAGGAMYELPPTGKLKAL